MKPTDIELYWSWVAVAVVVYLLGLVARRVTTALLPTTTQRPRGPYRTSASEQSKTAPRWYRVWSAALPLQPVLIAACAGFLPVPVPEFVSSLAARVIYFAVAGAASSQVYQTAKRTIAHVKGDGNDTPDVGA